MKKLDAKKHLKDYLHSPAFAEDFVRLRKRRPSIAIAIALDRTYGAVPKLQEPPGTLHLTNVTIHHHESKAQAVVEQEDQHPISGIMSITDDTMGSGAIP